MKKPFFKRWWFWLVVVIIVLGIFSGNNEESDQPASTQASGTEIEDTSTKTNEDEPEKEEPVKVEEVVEELSLEEKAEAEAKKVLASVEQINFNEDNGFLLIRGQGKENLTNKLTIKGFKLAIFNILKNIHDEQNVKTVDFIITYPLVDQYGNSSDQKVLSVELTRETMDKINYETFDYNNFENIADDYWEHQALQK